MKQTTPRTSTRTGHDKSVMPFSFMAKGAAAASVAGLVFAASPAHDAMAAAPDFVPKVRQGNPLMIPVGANWWARPALVDIDGDGDMDIFLGGEGGTITYFENIGTNTAPEFAPVAGSDNPFWQYDSGSDTYYPYYVSDPAPAFVDIDGDGDLDAFAGDQNGYFHFFQNTGSETAPAFTRYYPSETENPLNGFDVGQYASPSFADIDGDGDIDAFVGEWNGNVNFFENVGTPFAPVFELQGDEPVSKYLIPSSTINVRYMSSPAFADIDGDGDMDAFVGDYEGGVTVFKNSGSATDPAFTRLVGTASPTFGFDTKYDSAPAFADIDGDGDMDAFLGNDNGQIFFAKNTGTATTPLFTALADDEDPANPFKDVDVSSYSKPTFVDLDGDGDMDAAVGDHYSVLYYYENMGTASGPVFIQQLGTDNPLDGARVAYYQAPAFVDIDDDTDMDLFIGDGYGNSTFFENTGSATAPLFTTSGIQNPFGFANLGSDAHTTPAFADIDGDGDFDAVVGTWYNGLHYFENTGSATAPAFTELTGTDNPFTAFGEMAEALGVYAPTPAFVDIDGDGDMDLFVGEYYGRVIYFENRLITTPPVVDDDDDDDTPVVPADDDDTCFIDSVSGSTEKPNPLFSAMKNAYAAVRSMLR